MKPTVFERHPPREALIDAALAHTVHRPFWLEDAGERPVHPALHGEHAADLVVVGAGFLGLWAALIAKEREPSRSVIVLEGQRIGHAASGRNGGFCEASLTHGESNGRRRWPAEYDTIERLGLQNLDDFEATLHRHAIDCDFERTGLLTVAVEPYQDAALRDGADYLPRDAVRAELDSPTYLSGHWDRTGTAMLHPGKLSAGLARAAQALGVQCFEGSPATGLRVTADAIQVHTPQGRLQARQVVLATNAYRPLMRRWRWHSVPVYDYVLMTEPLSRSQLAAIGWRHRQGVADMANQFHYYRITRDNRILFGGYDAIYHYGAHVREAYEDRTASFRRLASHFFTTFPQLEGLHFTHRWGGAIDTSTRFCAYFGRAHDNRVLHAAGFTGLGVCATRFAAEVLLDFAEQRDTERTRLQMVRDMPWPFPPEPLAYAAVQASRWSLDQADHRDGRRNLLLKLQDALGLGFDT